jgi:hypothetical protein
MTIIWLSRLPRSVAARAAIVGATRALNADFHITEDTPLTDRIARALAAIVAAEIDATFLSVGARE